jgi:hypothetical protein
MPTTSGRTIDGAFRSTSLSSERQILGWSARQQRAGRTSRESPLQSMQHRLVGLGQCERLDAFVG